MSIRELETLSGADEFVRGLSTTARHNVINALVQSKFLRPPVPKTYTPEEIAGIEHSLRTGEGFMTVEEYLKSCEAEDRD
jgi:hypothetical protein